MNLYAHATSTIVELNKAEGEGWSLARTDLVNAVNDATGLLAGWGVTGFTGMARRALLDQVTWLCNMAANVGIGHMWMVGGEPRHPSRWHQYTSDKHGRTSGGDSEARLAHVLEPVQLDEVVRQAHARRITR